MLIGPHHVLNHAIDNFGRPTIKKTTGSLFRNLIINVDYDQVKKC